MDGYCLWIWIVIKFLLDEQYSFFIRLKKNSWQPRQIISCNFIVCNLQDAQKSTLMDMEIADYERLVKELNQKITDKDSRIEDLEQETGIQKQKQETLQEEISE